jgi:AraC-like DNA-binding protein
LRTPLSLIVGTIEMMQRDASIETVFAGPAGEGFRRDLDSIRTGAQHLSHLIGDVLDLASSQAGELRLSCAPLPLGDVLSRVAVLGETMARERGLAWRVDLGGGIEGPLPLVWGDRTRLQQVALNLISNAVKFTAKGTITLWVEVGAREVMVAVSDTGMGIPLAEQGLIFDEFRQSDRAARRGFGGMGLGLAISKRLVELHGGRMGVLSTGAEGSGSTFYFTLPVLTEAAVAAERLPQGGDAVLLLTEREPARGTPTAALRDHLLARGFVVSVLPVGERSDWLAQIVAAPPGAIALDYEPAAEQAWDLMRVLKLDPATSDIPVLFFALGDDERGAVLAMDYLAKPLGGEALAGALARQGLSDSERAFDLLVVDDDETMRELHARMVRSALPVARVLTAADGRAALQVMEEICPHLVLLDLMMPELDGFGVLEAMRDDPQLRGVPVIVLTAQILGRREMERLQGGVSAVLAKGLFEQGEVLAQVEAVLARGKRLGSEAQRVARMAMAYIHERYAEPVSREQMARDLNVNERYLTRCFGQETGLTPIAYLNRYRIAQARALLDRSRLSVTEVALACGFSDSSYFGRVFQKEVGLSPTVYRRHTLSHPD